MESNEMINLLSQILDERIGMVTAYAYAKSKGYSGSADDFANDMANIGVNISAIETAINTFNNQTVPNAETAITTAGSNQVTAVNTAGQEQLQNVTAEGGRQVGLVAAAGSAQTEAVNAAGASQVENVNTAGTTQITAIEQKGEETKQSIPSDYTALTNEVTDLKTSLTDLNGYMNNTYSIPWRTGYYNASGVYVSNANQLTTDMFTVPAGAQLTLVNPLYGCYLKEYSYSNGVYTRLRNVGSNSQHSVTISDTNPNYFYVACLYNSSAVDIANSGTLTLTSPIKDLYTRVDYLESEKTLTYTWIQGGIGYESENRICTDYVRAIGNYKLSLNTISGYGINVAVYDENKTRIAAYGDNTSTSLTIYLEPDQYYRIGMFHSTGMTPADGSLCTASIMSLFYALLQNTVSTLTYDAMGKIDESLTFTDGYYTKTLYWDAVSTYKTSEVIEIKGGELLDVYSWGYAGSVSMITECDSSGNPLSVLALSVESGTAPTHYYFNNPARTSRYVKATVNVSRNYGYAIYKRYVGLANVAKAKNVLFMGDSITCLRDYPSLIKNNNNNINVGVPGATFVRYTDADNKGVSFYDYVTAMVNDDTALQSEVISRYTDQRAVRCIQRFIDLDFSSIDTIVMWYGMNDYLRNRQLGTATETDYTKVLPCVEYGLNMLATHFPNVEIYCVGNGYTDRTNTLGLTPTDYADAVKEVCEKYAVPFYDMYRWGGVNAVNYASRLDDGIHPNAKQNEVNAQKIANFMKV